MTDDDARYLARRLHWDGEGEQADRDQGHDPSVESDVERSVAIGAVKAKVATPSFERRDLERRESVALERRRQLWRDSATILSAVVVALLVFRLLGAFSAPAPAASPSPIPSGLASGSEGIEPSLGPGQTFVPIVDPSLGIDATPTPIPVVTLPPTGTHAPSLPPGATPRPTTKPVRTSPPSPVPTPSPRPVPTPTPTPEPTPVPTPDVTPEPSPSSAP
jgi:hypothetical protein